MNEIQAFLSVFNTREQSLIIWLLLFFLWGLSQKKIRLSFCEVFKILFSKKIFIPLILMIIYVMGEIYFLKKIKLFNISMLKDVVFWFSGTAFVIVMNCNKKANDKKYFKKIIFESITAVMVVEFLIHFYTFNFIKEFILLPVLIIIVALKLYSEKKDDLKKITILSNILLCIYGIVLIVFSIYNLIINLNSMLTVKNLQSLFLPPALTFLFLPFIYVLTLLMIYENIFLNLSIWIKNDYSLSRFTKWQILKTCNFNLRKLNRFLKENTMSFSKLKNTKDVHMMIKIFTDKVDH